MMAAEQKATHDVFLEYRREGSLSSGNLIVQSEGRTLSAEGFEQVTYRDLLTRLARALVKTTNARVVLRRTDCANLFPYVLDQATVDLFRTDPVAAIHSMTFETPEAPVKQAQEPHIVDPPPLRVGYDTLSDAFGESVYVRTRSTSIECPGCGLWGEVEVGRAGRGVFTCHRRCDGLQVTISLTKLWAAVEVDVLLATGLKRFFLPRLWNEHRPWITREDLETKNTAYRAEKEKACSLLAATV
jgi:hypothetical protein